MSGSIFTERLLAASPERGREEIEADTTGGVEVEVEGALAIFFIFGGWHRLPALHQSGGQGDRRADPAGQVRPTLRTRSTRSWTTCGPRWQSCTSAWTSPNDCWPTSVSRSR